MAEARADRRLVDRCLSGDEHAWRDLCDRCHRPLAEVIRRQLGRRSAQEEIVQEVAARYWYALVIDRRRLERYDPGRGARLSTYLAHQARLETLCYLRAERRRRNRERRGPRRAKAYADAMLGVAVQDFIRDLTPREREFLEGDLLGQHVAGGAELTRANRWQLRHRVREKLRAFLGMRETKAIDDD